jgi:UDP-N-acetylmuramoyl-L-alanyl-D-glutamate--2,6-diaminopimelate ligase
MERYRDAKAELFRIVDRSIGKDFAKCAVVNADDAASDYMRSQTRAPALTYGMRPDADVHGRDVSVTPAATTFTIRHAGETCHAKTPLLGDYNVLNCLAASAVAISQGVDPRIAVEALATFAGVPGRMETLDEGQPFRVIVDIASTEQAMRNVLRVLRPATSGRIIVVFGAAGERDVERRSGIARAVVEGAHTAVITNEDPRSEPPGAILDEIAGALRECGWASGDQFRAIEDRREAIAYAFNLAKAGDTVLLAGKGTEQSIVIGTTHHPWDERAVARALLRAQFGV